MVLDGGGGLETEKGSEALGDAIGEMLQGNWIEAISIVPMQENSTHPNVLQKRGGG